MKHSVILLSLLILLGSWSPSDRNTSQYVKWDELRKLTWQDFQGMANPDSHADAATAIHLSALPYRYKNRIFYRVDAYFIPSRSWVREPSARLLAHEQLHFDIAELYARRARKKISELRQMGVRDVAEYNFAIQKVLEESNDTDRLYDRETIHGAISEKQKRWEREIALELQVLERFSSAHWK